MNEYSKREYPWYDIVQKSEELEQGDFLDSCEILIPTYVPVPSPEGPSLAGKPELRGKGKTQEHDVVVMSQSCDLGNRKLEYVLVCPRISYSTYKDSFSSIRDFNNAVEQIRQGKQYRYCMLRQCDLVDFPCEVQIIDFGRVFCIPFDVAAQMAEKHEKRLRLCSPYKEKLAQAFGYYYMRIGLPIDIEKLDGKAPT